MTLPDFWDDDSRFATLAEIEYLDRLDTALQTTERLCERLGRHARDDRGGQLHEIVARRLYVLDRSLLGLAEGAPADVFLRVRRVREAHEGHERATSDFPMLLADMYTAGLGAEECISSDSPPPTTSTCSRSAGSGAAPSSLPRRLPRARALGRTRRQARRARDRRRGRGRLGRTARARLRRPARARRTALRAAPANPTVVRRYRLPPDPLVRDSVRGYRTGRIDRVLAGDFDLF